MNTGTDKIKITILEDGTIKTETDKVSGPNHQNAESFLQNMARLCGGVVSRILKPGGRTHTHDGQNYHTH